MKHTGIKSPIATAALLAMGFAAAQTPAENPATPTPKHEIEAPKVERNLKVFDNQDFMNQLGLAN